MQDVLHQADIIQNIQIARNTTFEEDLEAQNLFDQIQLSNQQHKQQQIKVPRFNDDDKQLNKQKSSKRLKKMLLVLDSESEAMQQKQLQQPLNQRKLNYKKLKKDKKRKKKQKKLRKIRQSKKKKKQNNINELNQMVGQKKQQNQKSNEWSGQISSPQSQNDQISSDSLLQKLNPKSRLKLTQNKQGFSLKQLGNDPKLQLSSDQQYDSQSSRKPRKKLKKQKQQKKQVVKNTQILKSLLEKGLCVQEQQEKNEKQYAHNGLQEVLNIKNKKKGPKITNKLFLDMQINSNQQNQECMPKNIQLQIKAKISSTSSIISNSFLNKTEKLKKARGMETDNNLNLIESSKSIKIKQSMTKLINRTDLNDVQDIQLNVKVPQIVRGRGQLNNSMYLKRISSSNINNEEAKQEQPIKLFQSQIKKQKLNRIDFFKSMSEQLKTRKSKQVTNEVIQNSFKVTNLQQIQEMRKKNKQKKIKQALMGSDDDEWSQSQAQKQNKCQQLQMKQNKLGFMNFCQNNQQGENKKQSLINNHEQQNQVIAQQNLHTQLQTKAFEVQLKNQKINENDNQINQQNQQLVIEEQRQLESQNREQMNDQCPLQPSKKPQQYNQRQQNENDNNDVSQANQMNDQQIQNSISQQENEISQKQVQNAEQVELQVQLDVSSVNEYEQSSYKSNNQHQPNQQYQQYLQQLEEQGIQIKKNNRSKNGTRISNQLINKDQQSKKQYKNNEIYLSQDRKQFRKLRKLATIIKQKKIIQIQNKKAGQFFQEQAEEGSDNQNHDNQVKKIDYGDQAKQYEGIDLDAELEQLIDNNVDILQQNQDLAFQKYMQDVKIKDREELKRIMRGDFKRNRELQPLIEEMDEDQKKRIQRMQQFQKYIIQKQKQQGEGLYINQAMQNNQQNGDQSEIQNDQYSSNGTLKKKNHIIKQANQNQNDSQYEVVDQINQQNLKRYLDEGVSQTFITKTIVKKPKSQLPQSYQRQKKTKMRNGLKAKQQNECIKLKKTSSHLNELIMKNKTQIIPVTFMKNFKSTSTKK